MNSISHLKPSEINLVKGTEGQILPADGDSAEKYNKWKVGDVRTCTIKRARNLDFHRKYFKLLSLAFENQSVFESEDWFLEYVKIGIGYVDLYTVKETGETITKTKSISFDKCSQDEFEVIYQKTLTFIMGKYCFTKEFENELMSYI